MMLQLSLGGPRPSWLTGTTILVAISMLAPSGDAAGQGLLYRQARAGEIGVSAEGFWRQNGALDMTLNRTFRQWIKLPLRGVVLDRRFLSYNLTVRPTFRQNLSPGVPNALTSREFSFDFGADVLSAQPVSLVLSAGRTNGNTSGGFGSDGEFTAASMGGVLNVRFAPLPARLSYFSRSSTNLWLAQPSAAPVTWSNNTRTLAVVLENSKLRLGAERLLFDDRIQPNDFAVWNLNASHRFRWGKGSRLQSSFDRTSRSGVNPYSRQTWRERAHVQHTRVSSTQLGFQRHTSQTMAGSSSANTWNASFSTRVKQWLNAGLTGAARTSRFGANGERVLSGGPTAGLNFRLPLEIRFNAGGMFGYERRMREFSPDVMFEVVDQRHPVDATRSFILPQSGIDTATVRIRSEDLTLQYINNFDYTVLVLADLVEIVILPGSRIQVGDVVLVSYQFAPPDDPSGRLLIGRYNVGLSKAGFSLRYGRIIRNSEEQTPAATVALGALDETRINLSGRVALPIGRLDIDLARISRTSSALNFTAYEGNTSLGFSLRRALFGSVGVNARHSRQGSRTLMSQTAYVSMNWIVGRAARVTGRLQAWDLELDGRNADRSIGGNVDANIRIAAIDINMQYWYNVRTIPDSVTRSRLAVRLVRRF